LDGEGVGITDSGESVEITDNGEISENDPSIYLQADGAINPSTFFSQHPSLSQPARNLCERIIALANARDHMREDHTPILVPAF
jgi:hypothetical protein